MENVADGVIIIIRA